MKKIILLIICLIAFTGTSEACGGAKQPDGSWNIKYDFTRTMNGKTYFCCVHSSKYSKNENCKTKDEWIAYYERDVGEISYMNDMANIPDFDRHSTRDATINMTKEDGFWNNLRKFFKGEAGF